MHYARPDIHATHISICFLRETGQKLSRGTVRAIDQMMQILEGLDARFEVCYQGSSGYGHYHDLL